MSTDVPVSIWQPTQGNTEFDNTGVYYIVDTTGTFLVDPSGTFVVDTGVTATPIPATVWIGDDSI